MADNLSRVTLTRRIQGRPGRMVACIPGQCCTAEAVAEAAIGPRDPLPPDYALYLVHARSPSQGRIAWRLEFEPVETRKCSQLSFSRDAESAERSAPLRVAAKRVESLPCKRERT